MAEEIADVMAMSELAIERFNLDAVFIALRVERKKNMKRAWHAMLIE